MKLSAIVVLAVLALGSWFVLRTRAKSAHEGYIEIGVRKRRSWCGAPSYRDESSEPGNDWLADYNRVTASRNTAALIRTSSEVKPLNTMVRALIVTQTSRMDCAKSYFVC